MTRFIDRKTNWSKVVTIALTGASLAAPAFMAASAQADSFVPAAGYSQVQLRDRDRDDDVDFNDLNAGNTTVTGIVTQDLNGDRFEIQANSGQTFVVNLRGQNTASIQEGSRVRVTGLRNGNRITRATVQVLGNGNGNGYGYGNGTMRILQGRVTRDLSGRRFQMTSQGTTYSVILRRAEPLNLSEGDRVEVFGAMTNGNVFQADRVRIIRDNNGGGNGGGYNTVDFTGRVTDVQSQRRFTVRGENGATYEVRSDSSLNNRISEGDRVRVTGTSRGGNSRVINATRVQLRNGNGGGNGGGNNNDDGDTVSFVGTVRSSRVTGPGRSGIAVVETNNGRTFRVRLNDATTFGPGSRVRVRGTLDNGVVVNNQVDGA